MGASAPIPIALTTSAPTSAPTAPGGLPLQTTTSAPESGEFQPQNKNELKSAVDACIANDPTGMSCTKNGIQISQWDVSKVTDMTWMFSAASSFNGDLSSWDVSQVTTMS